MSMIKDGVGKLRIASTYLGSGLIVDYVTLNPVKSEALLANANFSGPNTTVELILMHVMFYLLQ